MKPIARVQAAIDAASGEAGEKHAVVMAAGGLPEVIQGRLDDGRTVRTYVWRKSRLGAIALVTGPDVEAKLHTLCEHTPGQPLGAVYLPARGPRPALSDSCCVPKVNPLTLDGDLVGKLRQMAAQKWIYEDVQTGNFYATPPEDIVYRAHRVDAATLARLTQRSNPTARTGKVQTDRGGAPYIEWRPVMPDGSRPRVRLPVENASVTRTQEAEEAIAKDRISVGAGVRRIASKPSTVTVGHSAKPEPLFDAKGNEYRATYRVITTAINGSGPVVPSNNPETMRPEKGYPPAFQARSLEGSGEAGKIRQIAKGLDPTRLLIRNADPTLGTPVVWAKGKKLFVLGGNGRTIAILSAPAERYAAYLAEGRSRWPYAFPKGQPPKGKRYILVRDVSAVDGQPLTEAQAVILAANSQDATSAAESPIGKALSAVRGLGIKSMGDLPAFSWGGIITSDNVGAFQKKNAAFVQSLLDRLDPAQAKLTASTPKLMADLVNAVMVGFLPAEVTRQGFANEKDERALLAAMPILVTLHQGVEQGNVKAGWDLLSRLDAARQFAVMVRNKSVKQAVTMVELADQQVQLGEGTKNAVKSLFDELDPLAVAFAILLKRAGAGRDPAVLIEETLGNGERANGMKLYLTAAEADSPRAVSMFGASRAPDPAVTLAGLQNLKLPRRSRKNPDDGSEYTECSKGGPFIGPRGGKWADAKHTIPFKEGGHPKAKQVSPKNPYLFDLDPFQLVHTETGKKKEKIDAMEATSHDVQTNPILVTEIDGNYHVLDGHHRTLVARRKNRPVRALVIPHKAVEDMRASGVHQAEMMREFTRRVMRGEYASISKAGPFIGPRLQRQNPADLLGDTAWTRMRPRQRENEMAAKNLSESERRRVRSYVDDYQELRWDDDEERLGHLNAHREALRLDDNRQRAESSRQAGNCPKCAGSGTIRAFRHRAGGVCFQCDGRGSITNPARAAVGGFTGASLTPGHLSLAETIEASEIAARAPTEGVRLGKGNFGEAWLLDGRVVKLANAENMHGQAQTISDQRGWMKHEAGVANELYEAGYTVVPRTIYVEPDGHPGVVREYGEPVTDPSMEEISELEAALYRVESDGIEGWDVADDLLVMRRPDGSIYIADVGFWQKRKRARKPGWRDKSEVGTLLSGWVHKGGGDKALAWALSAGSSLFGAGADLADDIADDIAEGDPTSFSLAIMVQTLMNAIETREAVGLYVPANLHNLLAQGFALSSQDPEMLSVIEEGNKIDRQSIIKRNPAAYASTLPAEPTRFLNALGRGPQGFAEPFPLGLHYLVEHGLAEHTNCVDASKTLYNRDTCTFGLTKTGLSRLRSMRASHDQESARRQTALFNPAWLSLEVVEAAAAAAAEQDVSERARAPGQFVNQYQKAGGDRDLLDPAWAKKRDGFVARHMAQVEASNEDLFTPDGEPTRRHLALAVWAYSPDPAALSAWLLGPIRNPAKVFVRRGILVTHYEPYDLDGAFIRVESQVYDLNGRPSTLDYDGPGQIIDYEPYDSGATLKRLVLGDPYAETRLDEYVVDTEPTEASDEYDAGYRKGFTEKRRSADRTISKWSPDRLDGWQQGRSDRRQGNPRRINGEQIGLFDSILAASPGQPVAESVPWSRPNTSTPPKSIELFSGGGLFSLAQRVEGVIAQHHCELDGAAVETIRLNLDDTASTCDVRAYTPKPVPGGVDILSGGPPCQPWSQGGSRQGVEDERNLWPRVLELVDQVKPRIVLMENVAGILYKQHAAFVSGWWERMADLGYEGAIWSVLAADYGSPQLRARVWFVAWPAGAPWGEALGTKPPPRYGDPRTAASEGLIPWVRAFDRSTDGCCGGYGYSSCVNLMDLDGSCGGCIDGSNYAEAPNEGNEDELSPAQIAYFKTQDRLYQHPPIDTGGAFVRDTIYGGRQAKKTGGYLAPTVVKGASKRTDGSQYLTIGTKPGYTLPFMDFKGVSSCLRDEHLDALRPLSVREIAKLQSVPQWYAFAGSEKEQQNQVGNGIDVNMGRAVIQHAMKALGYTSPFPGSMAAEGYGEGLWPMDRQNACEEYRQAGGVWANQAEIPTSVQSGIADMTRRAASVTEDLWDRNSRDVYAPSTDGIEEMIERGWTELNDLLDEDLTVLKLVFDRKQFPAPKSAQEWARSKGYAVEPFAVTGTHLEITQAARPHVKGAVEVVEFESGVRALIAPTVAR